MYSKLATPFLGQNRSQGMTLIEIIIVMAILGGLMAAVISGIMNAWEQAKIDEANLRMSQLTQPLILYKAHTKKFPASGLTDLLYDPGVSGWRGPYVDDEAALQDPWGQTISFTSSGNHFRMQSAGPDQVPDTEDDVTFEKGRQQARRE